MDIPLFAIARGREGHWEAICFDFDIAVQGHTFNDVERLLAEAVETYIEDALKEDEATRKQLLTRRAPLSVRLYWLSGLVLAALSGRAERGWDSKRNGSSTSATVPFAVPCHT
jgi:predicted RNase H-like HicB family nuclease